MIDCKSFCTIKDTFHLGSPLVDDRPIMNAVKYRVVSGVVWTNRTMVCKDTEDNEPAERCVLSKVTNKSEDCGLRALIDSPAAPILADQQARPVDVRRGARQTTPSPPSQRRRLYCALDNRTLGAAVVYWLDYSPPTNANRVRFPAGSLPRLRMWESCWTMPHVGGFSRGSPTSPAPSFRRRSVYSPHFNCAQSSPYSTYLASHPRPCCDLQADFVSHALDEFDPTAELQGKDHQIPCYLSWSKTWASFNEQLDEALVDQGFRRLAGCQMNPRDLRFSVDRDLQNSLTWSSVEKGVTTSMQQSMEKRRCLLHAQQDRKISRFNTLRPTPTDLHFGKIRNGSPISITARSLVLLVSVLELTILLLVHTTPDTTLYFTEFITGRSSTNAARKHQKSIWATVAERLDCALLTKSIWAQSPAGSLRIFACGNRAGRCRWSAGFLGDLPFPPPFHSGASPYSPQSPSSALKSSMPRGVQISSLTQ
ncbi:hypothetical protein PR048_030752 [Dryococelus australis]|uniref:Uncharacterized protein n=1 Tax=Dryococelus australis TaxID=614101 RepID=A0ABQ9G9S9_9NEOP|nr:hypothetical protein PR048_030752 [Dryococelus australis]